MLIDEVFSHVSRSEYGMKSRYKTEKKSFEKVEKLKYLGKPLTNRNSI
jgi:hypothetical protein